MIKRYDPDQPRAAAGSEIGGQWIKDDRWQRTQSQESADIIGTFEHEYAMDDFEFGTQKPDPYIYEIKDFSKGEWALLSRMMVDIKDNQILGAWKDVYQHEELLRVAGIEKSIDNFVRMHVTGTPRSPKIEVEVYTAGVVVYNDDDENKALDNIYKVLDVMVNKGLPPTTKVIIYRLGSAIETTAKTLKRYNPDQPRDPAGSPTGGQWTATRPVQLARTEVFLGDPDEQGRPTYIDDNDNIVGYYDADKEQIMWKVPNFDQMDPMADSTPGPWTPERLLYRMQNKRVADVLVHGVLESFPNEYKLEIDEADDGESSGGIRGTIYRDGFRAGSCDFEVTEKANGLMNVHVGLLSLDRNYQGEGFTTEFFNTMEKRLMEKKVYSITLHANLDVGGYAWARLGFEPADPDRMNDLKNDVIGEAHRIWDDEQTLDDVTSMIYETETIWDLATLYHDNVEIGKRGLLGTNWDAVKYLDPKRPGYNIGQIYYEEKLSHE